MSFLTRILKTEPVVVSGLLTSAGAALAGVDNWKAAYPVLIAWALRQFVTPVAAVDAVDQLAIGPAPTP